MHQLVTALPAFLRAHAQDQVITSLLTDDLEFQFDFDGRPVRIPTDRNANPRFGGELVNDEILAAKLGLVGTTGWRWDVKETAFANLDFDGLNHADGHSEEELQQVVAAVRRAGYAWVKRSKGGVGVHGVALCRPMLAATGAAHTANVNAIIDRLCEDADFDFRRFMCSKQVCYFWSPDPLPPDAFKVLCEPTSDPPEIETPEPPTVGPKQISEFSEEHKADIAIIEQGGYRVIVSDGRVLTHSKGVEFMAQATGRVFPTTSPGRNPDEPNGFMYAIDGGGWSFNRFGVSPEKEAPGWHANAQGFASRNLPPRPDKELLRVVGAEPTATEPTATEPTATEPTATEPTATEPKANWFEEVAQQVAKQEAKQEAEQEEPTDYPVVTCRELCSTKFNTVYYIPGVLVAGQPCTIGAEEKSFKTYIALDGAVSLASATPFLGKFPVPSAMPVLFLSGESGFSTLSRNAKCICDARGIAPPDNLFLGEDLPQFGKVADMEKLSATIRKTQAKVCFVDPCYFCCDGLEHTDVFTMGKALANVNLACKKNGATLVLLHHFRKQQKNKADDSSSGLAELAMAGFREFTRQWVLLYMRKPFVPDGVQSLKIKFGGSAGHSSEWALNIDEGTQEARRWGVTVSPLAQTCREEKIDITRRKLLDALASFPDGLTKTRLFQEARVSKVLLKESALESLLVEGALVPCRIKGANNQSYDGYKLA